MRSGGRGDPGSAMAEAQESLSEICAPCRQGDVPPEPCKETPLPSSAPSALARAMCSESTLRTSDRPFASSWAEIPRTRWRVGVAHTTLGSRPCAIGCSRPNLGVGVGNIFVISGLPRDRRSSRVEGRPCRFMFFRNAVAFVIPGCAELSGIPMTRRALILRAGRPGSSIGEIPLKVPHWYQIMCEVMRGEPDTNRVAPRAFMFARCSETSSWADPANTPESESCQQPLVCGIDLPNFGRRRSILGLVRATWDNCWSESAESAEFDQTRPSRAQVGPTLANVGPHPSDLSSLWLICGRSWRLVGFGQTRPKPAELDPRVGRSWGRVRRTVWRTRP